MSRHPERQVEPRAADPYGAAVHPGAAVGAEPRRPAGQRRRRAVEGERERGHPQREGVDQEIRHGQLRRRPVPSAPRPWTQHIYHFKSASYVSLPRSSNL